MIQKILPFLVPFQDKYTQTFLTVKTLNILAPFSVQKSCSYKLHKNFCAAAVSGAPLLWMPLATGFVAIVEGVVVAAFNSRHADTLEIGAAAGRRESGEMQLTREVGWELKTDER